MDFSTQLDDLQQRAADAKTSAQAAVSESRDQLRQRIDQAKVEVDLAAKDARQQVDEAAASARSKWAQMKADAADTIEFAAWTVDHARLAVLDAIDSRVYADELAQQGRRQ
jgi:F0F1-type ATP synthase membrane subunit b/b'